MRVEGGLGNREDWPQECHGRGAFGGGLATRIAQVADRHRYPNDTQQTEETCSAAQK